MSTEKFTCDNVGEYCGTLCSFFGIPLSVSPWFPGTDFKLEGNYFPNSLDSLDHDNNNGCGNNPLINAKFQVSQKECFTILAFDGRT